MSMKLMVKVMEIKVGSPVRKLVLLKIADNANDDYEAFPSYETIADHCELNKRSVMRHVNQLVKDGLLTKTYRKGPKGNSTNIYRIVLPSDKLSPPTSEVVTESHQGSDTESLGVVTESHPEQVSLEQVIEPLMCFDTFWVAYDKRVNEKKCKGLWEKLTKKEILTLSNHVLNYVDSTPDKTFRKDPERYLTQKGFNNEIIIRNSTASNKKLSAVERTEQGTESWADRQRALNCVQVLEKNVSVI